MTANRPAIIMHYGAGGEFRTPKLVRIIGRNWPACGLARGSNIVQTPALVTCKRCLALIPFRVSP